MVDRWDIPLYVSGLFLCKGIACINSLVVLVNLNRAVRTDGVPVIFVHMVSGNILLVIHHEATVIGSYPQVQNFTDFVRVQSRSASGEDEACGVTIFLYLFAGDFFPFRKCSAGNLMNGMRGFCLLSSGPSVISSMGLILS